MILEGTWWDEFLLSVKYPPGSLWFIMFISILVSFISTTLNKLLIDQKALEEKQKVIKDHNAKKKYLSELAESDPKKYAKEYRAWKKVDASVTKMQQKMSLERMKPMCVTFLPIMIFFWLLRSFYSVDGVFHVETPMNPWDLFYAGKWYASFQSTIGLKSWGWINFLHITSLFFDETFIPGYSGKGGPNLWRNGFNVRSPITLPNKILILFLAI